MAAITAKNLFNNVGPYNTKFCFKKQNTVEIHNWKIPVLGKFLPPSNLRILPYISYTYVFHTSLNLNWET